MVCRTPGRSHPFYRRHCGLTHARLGEAVLTLPRDGIVRTKCNDCTIVRISLSKKSGTFCFITFETFERGGGLHLRMADTCPVSRGRGNGSIGFFAVTCGLLEGGRLPRPSGWRGPPWNKFHREVVSNVRGTVAKLYLSLTVVTNYKVSRFLRSTTS